MEYYHLDVFTDKPFSGNGLTVFINDVLMEKSFMQTVTQEMRQFESIFLTKINSDTFRAFIFTMEEELDFAGHPIIGAAALLHDLYSPAIPHANWTFVLNAKSVEVNTKKTDNFYSATMNQGNAEFLYTLNEQEEVKYLSYLNLSLSDKAERLSLQVITTGLPYLIIPVKTELLPKVKVVVSDLETKLAEIQAKFFYVFANETMQGRTWDNFGIVEDIATGSAAGPVAAYLIKNDLAIYDNEILLNQGEFLNRPSLIKAIVKRNGDILVSGNVCKIAIGQLL
jgi:PhzF family phenazine biosynthesis protein